MTNEINKQKSHGSKAKIGIRCHDHIIYLTITLMTLMCLSRNTLILQSTTFKTNV